MVVYTVLGLDPGTNNYGFCHLTLGVAEGGIKCKIHRFGKILGTIHSLVGKEVNSLQDAYDDNIERCIEDGPALDLLIAERFQTRGFGGPTIEAISYMLGRTTSKLNTDCRLIIASQWKTAFNKYSTCTLQEIYDSVEEYSITPHEVDAFLIACYGISMISGISIFSQLSLKMVVGILLKNSGSRYLIGEKRVTPKKRKKRR